MGMLGDLELTKNSGNARPGGLGGLGELGRGRGSMVGVGGRQRGGATTAIREGLALSLPLQGRDPSKKFQAKPKHWSCGTLELSHHANPRHVVCEEKHGPFSEARAATRPNDSTTGKATARTGNPTVASGWQAHYVDGDVLARPAARGARRTAARNLSADRRTRHHRLLRRSFAILCRRGSRARPPGASGWLSARMETPTPRRRCAR